MVHDDAPLARFIFNTKDVTLSTGRVKYGAFMPKWEATPERFELSTFDVGSLPVQAIDEIAAGVERERNVAREGPPQTVKGWAEAAARCYASCGLTLDPDGVPERHVNVLGWPGEREDKPAVRLAAQRVAGAFEATGGRFVLRTPPA